MFQGKVAIVTGGGTGIGRAISMQLAQAGAVVSVIYSRSVNDAQQTVGEIVEQGGRALAVQANVANDSEARAMVAKVVDTYGGVDYLVNNAGITRQLSFADLEAISDEIWDELLAVNVKGTFHCSRAAAPFLKLRRGAAIVNVGSVAGETGFGSSLPYAVSKSAVHGLTRSLARALAPTVRVNCVAPGVVDTRWWAGNEERMQSLAGHVALNRISTPLDVAKIVLLLLTAESMTGQIIRAENGQTL
jgi:3-oxoacyl-[acyl-carrier protein] reductase